MSEIDTRQFESAMRFVLDSTGKEAAPMLNKYALQSIIGAKGVEGAMQLTPKADPAKIKGVSDRQIAARIATRLRRSGKLKGTTPQAFKAMVVKEKKRRLASSGYTAFIGWTPAAKAFGGRGAVGKGKAKVTAQFEHSEARHGMGAKATAGRLVAEFTNTAPMSEKLGTSALQQALAAQAADMEAYGTRKLQEAFNKVK